MTDATAINTGPLEWMNRYQRNAFLAAELTGIALEPAIVRSSDLDTSNLGLMLPLCLIGRSTGRGVSLIRRLRRGTLSRR